ncbi:MAG: ABC-F family ATP-binding cassette domain-containing protein [Gemmatimonadetes bacterium]|jgi:ATP-binding cassette subfamily F protein 3|nr:ABC-F family ATP-binding cassette domain-containing protein [Gemmatimonadota bacterium]MBT5329819.1 ABC-F family ATP-binding cassette domain-containing protein [Gemmatimonadota bacterium]MBT5449655.1 ABC-F family ATP-binding cassette domain-containing protein [Gemmatimonadota bacterium]MBT5800741.1 ABC-F family ATP-binding cassette domain-containing protein [Gemmatimonadota bacterium]MBT6621271.1 ABC-F family ATP-binding cassette domain-containing protein [Gemmatimonadota bacterium]
MSLLKGAGVGKYFGAQDVFKNLDFSIEMADRIGLVGPNGEGKTTLLEILAGVQEATAGQLQSRRDLRIGYLPQDPPVFAGMTLWQGMLEAFADLRRLEAELQELAQRLHDAEVLPRYSALQTEFERREGYTYETRIRTVLMGVGFGEDDFQLDMAHLSGGQRTRSLLARLLLEDPELLLLDEPTNHLDLVAVEWLESFLQNFKGGLVVVSHDRYFLDTVSNRTWEMAFGVLETYRGNYSAYARQRGERYQRRLKEWQEQQEYIAKTEDFIRRHIAGQRTKEAQGRRTRLQRFMRDEAIAKPQRHEEIRVRLSPPKRSGDIVLDFSDVEIGYEPERPILRMPDMELRRGMRVAVVGPNGAGKTTLMRSILGDLATLAGKIKTGTVVEMGYLSQDHDYLDKGADLVDTVRRIRPDMSIEETRTLLGSFLFKGDEVFKPIGELSGGQRSRLALVRLAVQEVNVLVLDEPTNHLDIASQEVLEDVLANFDGTFLLVSHDRYLVQALATHVWAVGEGAMQVMEGGWEVYLQWRETRRGAEEMRKASRQDEREVQRETRRERKQLEKMASRQREVEEEIAQLEEQMALLSERISAVGEKQDMEQVHALGEEYGELEQILAGLWREWEELGEVLEAG